MSLPPAQPRDPIGWTALLVAAFAVLAGWRLAIPSHPFFDEIHYLPAARALLDLSAILNPEHPPLGKELIALGIRLAGDDPLGWRIMPFAAGLLALWAFCRALWFATLSRFASLAGGVLLVAAFPLLVQARIAMLDVFMLAFVLVALWQCAGAMREPETARRRLALAGMALGAAMASKWNAIPVAVLPGLAFLATRLAAGGWRGLLTRRGPPVPGMRLWEAALWLGALPLLVYTVSYLPYWFVQQEPLTGPALPDWHRHMLELQHQALPPHPYQSRWWQWISDWRPIWYLYEPADGAQRGVLLVGNPVVLLAGLPALLWCLLAGLSHRRWDALAVAVLYVAGLGLWVVADKNVQFFYHYTLPGLFLTAALALALDALWRRGRRILPLMVPAAALAILAWFYPILTAAPLAGPGSFTRYTWLDSWR